MSLATIATLVMVACASAQMGPGSTSGTKCTTPVSEGSSTLGPIGFFSRQFSLPTAWQGAFGSYFASQFASASIARTTSVPVVARRPIAKH